MINKRFIMLSLSLFLTLSDYRGVWVGGVRLEPLAWRSRSVGFGLRGALGEARVFAGARIFLEAGVPPLIRSGVDVLSSLVIVSFTTWCGYGYDYGKANFLS